MANAKRAFSDLLGRVAYGHETVIITRRGRPMAKIVPIQKQESQENELVDSKGWLDEDELKGFWAVKVSGNWRVVFRFERGDAWEVDYDDYH